MVDDNKFVKHLIVLCEFFNKVGDKHSYNRMAALACKITEREYDNNMREMMPVFEHKEG